MQYYVYKTEEEIAAKAGEMLCEVIRGKADAVLGLATGATPLPTYAYLQQQYQAGKVSFRAVRSFNLDEYCGLPKQDPNSYYSYMMENLFSKVDMQPENINFLDGNAADAQAESARFGAAIAAAGGIDVQLLGIGRNGHIGFNEPAESFSDTAYQTALTQSTIEANQGYFAEGAMPRYAFTMGIGDIMRAKEIILIATGASKAAAVRDMLKGPVTPQCPASVLQQHAQVTVFLDEAAASLL